MTIRSIECYNFSRSCMARHCSVRGCHFVLPLAVGSNCCYAQPKMIGRPQSTALRISHRQDFGIETRMKWIPAHGPIYPELIQTLLSPKHMNQSAYLLNRLFIRPRFLIYCALTGLDRHYGLTVLRTRDLLSVFASPEVLTHSILLLGITLLFGWTLHIHIGMLWATAFDLRSGSTRSSFSLVADRLYPPVHRDIWAKCVY